MWERARPGGGGYLDALSDVMGDDRHAGPQRGLHIDGEAQARGGVVNGSLALTPNAAQLASLLWAAQLCDVVDQIFRQVIPRGRLVWPAHHKGVLIRK